MTWLKYADKPLMCDQWASHKQVSSAHSSAKPVGYWITDDSEHCWRSWCKGEGFRLEGLVYKHEVDLDESNILIIRDLCALDAFAREFRTFYIWGPPEAPRRYRDVCIDWCKVAEQHSGIIITPYQWSKRMADNYFWYYGWDCASGCVWDLGAIKDVRLVEIDTSVLDKKEEEAA